MSYIHTFERKEMKYLLTTQQFEELLVRVEPWTREDAFGHYTASNLYFDTNNYDLIKRSVEKPVYKEKLRLRCYNEANAWSTSF